MILITLGTQDKPFTRLLDAIQKAIDEHIILDEVVVQAGHTKYRSDNMKIFDFINQAEFSQMLEKADIVITHGGVGTIMTALKNHKKILAAARLSEYGEHQNDHQIQILESFDEQGYLIYMKNLDDISRYYHQILDFTPKEYESNQMRFIAMLENWIENN